MTHTFGSVLALYDVQIPDETLAELEVPVLSGPQRQGDVLIVPAGRIGKAHREARPIPADGVAVVRGEATGNTHLLHAEGDCLWAPADLSGGSVNLGTLLVDPGAVAYLIHTDEHGANAIRPGCYSLHGKREMAAEIRRVAD